MTFDEVKEEILHRARRLEVCDIFHDMSMATTYQELIYAGLPMIEFAWRTGIIDAALLDEFTAGILEDNGIYLNMTATVSGPPVIPCPYFDSYEIFILGGSDITTAFTGTKKFKVNVLGANATITVGDTAYLQLNTYNGSADITISNGAIGVLNLRNPDTDVVNVFLEDNAVADIFVEANTTLNLDIQDAAFCKLKTFNKGTANTNVSEDPDFIVGQNYNSSLINYGAPV